MEELWIVAILEKTSTFDSERDAREYAEKHVHEHGELTLFEATDRVFVSRRWDNS